jgi:membrane dipeptidase
MNGHRQLQPEDLGRVAERLQYLGYAPADIRAIFGANFMRIARAAWPE